ncbi:hypothetical protein PPL_05854 [Heterostelium album PN500]|uniref:RRM domain-containing protein n=1 Tax=Heterostelium pallidum (strain ATCC 26659 / Pp 5 / PN500) TaxID=670386 RepID=D3BBI6_HETP5|nr:hypothetical protein PPL_05854 [Heterostelium album PN500]EFA81019.1 hypothetical protein PPL_05854 [Heterostelium album PN500]|eukprot:XP_020433137.1 hypothetical protein PPL_05854 [Heterostelium album PN500]
MDQSLDSIISTQRKQKRSLPKAASIAGGGGGESQTSTNQSPLESSLGDIIKSKKKDSFYVKKRDNNYKKHNQHQQHNNNHHHHHHNKHNNNSNGGNGEIVITIKNDQQFRPLHQYQQQQHQNNNYNNNRNNNDYRNQALLNRKRNLAKKIDHSLFDSRGIRDYSQVEKRERDENNVTLRVANIAPSVTQSDLTKVFSVIGKLKDVDLLTHLSPVEAIVTYHRRIDALTAIDRFNGVPIDGSELKISLDLNNTLSPSNSNNTTTTTTTTSTTFTIISPTLSESSEHLDEMVN